MAQSISTATAEHYTWSDSCDGWHLLRTADLSVIEERVPPGAAEARHYHQRSHQFFYILQGTAILEIDGEVHGLQAGQGIEVCPGQSHQLRNEGNAALRFLVISMPPSHGDRLTLPGSR